jgi:ketosteroid isomerase-like protein
MKSGAFRSMLFGILTIALLQPAGAAPPDDDAAAVANLERDLVAAIAQKDLATYDRIVADDYVVFDSSGKQLTKADVVASYRTGTRGYTNLEIYDVVARVFGDTAIVTAKTKGFRHEDGRDVPNRVRYIRVFARRAGRWQAVTQMSAPMEDQQKKSP